MRRIYNYVENGCRIIKKKRSRKKKLFIALTAIAALVACVYIFIARNVNPMIVAISNEKIRALTSEAVGNAVIDVMSDNPTAELMDIVRDDKGNVKSVELHSDAISALAQEVTLCAQRKINEIGEDGIRIPIGSLSGVTLFTGLGPDINIKIYLVGSTKTKITSVFTESGINQTLHRLYLDISGSVAVAVPGLPSTVNTSAQVLMSEMIIIGEVPPTYLHAASVGDMLDLIVD